MKSFAFALLSLFLFAAITTVMCDDDDDDDEARGLGAAASTLVDVLQFKLQHTRKTSLWKKAVKAVYNLTVYPYNEFYIKGGALPNVLASNVCGRVHPFGKHCGIIDVAEYYYGLTPNNITFDTFPSTFILEVLMTKFFIDLETKTAFSTINYVVGPLSRAFTLNATQVGTFRFDNQDKIVEFDLWNPLYSTNTRRGINYRDPVYQNNLVNQTCDRHRRFCNGTNQQYESVDACTTFLKSIPFGEPDVFTANNVLCRHQHATLVSLRPEIHCPHIGPTGGDFCRNENFNDYFQVPYFSDKNRLIAPMIAY